MNERDTSELETRLRQALRPVEPPPGLESRVAAAIARAGGTAGPAAQMRARWPVTGLAASVAAGMVVAGGLAWSVHRADVDRAQRAGEQIRTALSLASAQLTSALALASSLSASDADGDLSTKTDSGGSRADRRPQFDSHD
ncbi:MAG TPA: hypothetical protein VMU67_08375 [Steroidobacteraceae bacterium]|nr:hypothetical protein [Steroidobacteraceae bacterium]